MSSALGLNDTLIPGQSLYSPGGAYFLTLQGDSNLVLYRQGSSTAMWQSGTFGTAAAKLIMQPDGNLVIYDVNGKPVWASSTNGKGLSFAQLQDDGNFVIYLQGAPTWATQTNTSR